MTRTTRIKLTIAAILMLGALGYLAYAGFKGGWASYHLTVDQFQQDPKYHTQRVRLAGRVADEGVTTGSGRLGARFDLHGESSQVPVVYDGVLPDLFKPGCDVVVEGRLDSAGVFQAHVLMTKCASKYEVAEHGNRKPGRAS